MESRKNRLDSQIIQEIVALHVLKLKYADDTSSEEIIATNLHVDNFHDQDTFLASLDEYYKIIDGIKSVVDRKNTKRTETKENHMERDRQWLVNMPYKPENCHCAASASADFGLLILELKHNLRPYPGPYMVNIPKESFVHWLEILKFFSEQCLSIYAMEAAIAQVLTKGNLLVKSDYDDINKQLVLLESMLDLLDHEDKRYLSPSTAENIRTSILNCKRLLQKCQQAIAAHDSEELLIKLEWQSRSLGNICATLSAYLFSLAT